jgi:menaquinone-9 beta-reductase
MDHYDLAIVGAGPAGTAAALSALAVDPSQRVVLVDRARFPRDKTCGDGVGPAGVTVLEKLGVAYVLDGAARIGHVRLRTAAGARAGGGVPPRGD